MARIRKFEVGLYNEAVRKCLERAESHPDFSDEWAEIRYIEVEALSEQDAKAKIASRYPSQHGFVIKRCTAMDEYE